MAEPSAEPIPPDFAEAFAYAVLVYEIWTPEEPGRLIQIGPRSYSIVEVCRLVDQFTDRLPDCARTCTTILTPNLKPTLRPILHMQQRFDASAA